MRISQAGQIRKPIPLTPLVDIVFLLLMFFMLSSTFTKFSVLDVSAATTGGTASAKPAFPGVIIIVNGPDSVSVNGAPMSLQGLPARLDELERDGARRVALRPGPQASVQDLVAVLEAAQASRIATITVVE